MIHTNTIEGFLSLLQRARMGSSHRYSLAVTPLLVAERQSKRNHRNDNVAFGGSRTEDFA